MQTERIMQAAWPGASLESFELAWVCKAWSTCKK